MDQQFCFFPKKAAFAWEKCGVQDLVFPVILVRTLSAFGGALSSQERS